MSRLGKSFKNRFLRRALAMVLAGTMVLSGMPVSFAAELSDSETFVEPEVSEGTDDVSEEAAEDNEAVQKESEKAETEEQESTKSTEESEVASEEISTAADESKEEKTASDASKDTVVASETEESETSETDTEETSETEGSEEENEDTYTSATFATGHENAMWSAEYIQGTLLKDTGEESLDSTNTPVIQSGKKGIYKNKVEDGDILYIDTAGSNGNGKFGISTDKIQIRQNTKIHIPVKTDKSGIAKITIYQSGITDQNNVIYSDGDTTNTGLEISKDGSVLSDVVCTTFAKKGNYYQTELTITLNDSDTFTSICVEVMNGDISATKIISGEEVRDDIYDSNEGNDEALVKYNMEGFANSYGVTGGGMLKKGKSESYYTVSNAVEFLEALAQIKASGEPAVIEVIGDLNLGSKELGKDENGKDNLTNYAKLIKADEFQALWHPTLKTSGVSDLTLEGFNNLTIFSSNDKGATIKHCNIIVKRSTNIVIRNFVFDELWEWDDGGSVDAEQKTYDRGGYDRNDWDYLCIDTESDGIWIDHCTFYKAYDGVIDVKNAKENGDERVTISWCKFEPKSAPDESGNHPFFDAQLEELEKDFNSSNPKAIYYKSLRTTKNEEFTYTYTKYSNKVGTETTETLKGEGYEPEDIVTYTMGQKKTHLLGQSDGKKAGEEAIPSKSRGIKVTLANNSYKNSMDRMPRLRFGVAHEYNCTLDSSELDAARKAGSKAKSHLVSNGAISTMGGYVFLENCYIDGIELPLNSGNGESERGYIGQTGSIYKYKNDKGEDQELKVVNNSNSKSPDYGKDPLPLTKAEFEEKLPDNYGSYQLCAAADLNTDVIPYAGAGSVKMSAVQWLKTSYGADNTGDNPNPDNPDNPNPDDPDNPPAETNGKEFRASSLEVQAALTADSEVNEFYTITKGCEIAEGKATINDIYFTKYIKLSTKGSKEHSIQITSPGKGTVTVYAAAGDAAAKAAAGTLNLLDDTGSTVVDFVADITDAASFTLEIPKKGIYYVASADSEIHIYGIDLNAEEGGEEEEPAIEFSLRADEIELEKLTSDYTKNNFTIKVKSGTTLSVDASSKGDYTKCIKLGGEGKVDNRSIHFTAEDTGTLTVYAVGSNKTDPKTLILYKLNGSQGIESSRKNVEIGTTLRELKFDISEIGDYYVGGDGGINIYCIAFSNKKEEPTPPDDDDYAPEEVDAEWVPFSAPAGDVVYSAEDAANNDLTKYNQEGYAAAANVTGGGLLKDDSPCYHKVTNELEFIQTLSSLFRVKDKPHVIEITTDLNLGNLELNEKYKDDKLNVTTSGDGYSNLFRAQQAQARMHPTLKKTGVSYIKLNDFHNLTIFSKNGATIKHAEIDIEGESSNIIIRNLTFDELWEWDEGGLDAKGKYQNPGDYDINDWDYIEISDNAEGVWIDHCTFYKAYDGIIDAKNPSPKDLKIDYQRITISWCEVLPGSKDNVFFNEQMKWLEDNINNEEVDIAYYRQLREENMKAPNADKKMSAKDVWWYAYGQKKTHLFGSDDSDSQDKAIRVTLANNYYKNSMSRLPRLRFGKVHEYNCVLDSYQMNEEHKKGNPHITGNGAISACNGEMLLENCYIRGLRSALRSGYSDKADDRGYIDAINSVYYMEGQLKEPEILASYAGKKITDETKFKEKLPEGYAFTTRDATQLYSTVVPYAGAGKLDMTTVQWEATNYGTNDAGTQTPASPSQTEPAIPSEYDKAPTTPWDNPENPDDPDNPPAETVAAPTASPANEAEFPSTGGEVTLNCATNDATIYYTISETEAGLTDPADKTNASRVPYVIGTKIPITKETYIWAVAVKDDKTSEPLKCHYTVAAEGAVLKPFATPNPSTPVASGTKVTLSTTGEVDAIYYTKGATPDATADPREENSGREIYNNETGIVITEAVTIKAVAKKDVAYSEIVTFTYTISIDDPEENDQVKAPEASPAAGAVKAGTIVRLSSATPDAKIYYTTDGITEPTIDSKLYTEEEPITITAAMTIKAFAVKEGLNDSAVVTLAYTIAQDPDDPNPPITPVDPDDPGVDKTDIWITGLEAEYYYTGAKIIPDIKVWDCDIQGGDRLLIPGVDYAATYKNNSKVSTGSVKAEVIITGKGNYAGKGVTEKFSIVPAKGVENPINVKGAKIDKITDQQYKKGEAIYPDFKLTLKGKPAVTYTYNNGSYVRADGEPMDINVAVSNNVNQGKAAILVTGAQEKGKTTSVKAAFKITPIDLSKVTLDVEAESAAYAVKGAIPVLTVKYDGKTLVNGRDYVAKYGNNKKAGGKGSVTISGKGNYAKNAKPVSYDVKQLDMSELSVSAATVYDKVKAGKIKATVLDKDGNELKPAQYTLEVYKEDGSKYGANDELKAGEAVSIAAVAKDKVNLTGSTPKTDFKVGKDISKAKFKLKKSVKKPYTGSEVTLIATDFEPVTLKGATGNLEMGRDFEIVAYSNNINKGNATAIIRGIGDYSGTKTIKFKITPQTMMKGSIKTTN